MKKKAVQYLVISFVWTWACWLFSYFFSKGSGYVLKTDATLFDLFTGLPENASLLAQLIFALGVFGPLVGFLVAAPRKKGFFPGKIRPEFAVLAIIIPIAASIPCILLSLLLGYGVPNQMPLAALSVIVLYFISNLLTSGTEEFGWRGFLYPYMREKDVNFWRVSYRSGLIWAVWHFPLMFLLYWNQGLAVLLPSMVGLIAGIVAMAYISNFLYDRTSSIGLCMVLHAMNNTFSFLVLLFFPKTPFTFLSSVMAWAVVGYLDKKYKIDKKVSSKQPTMEN